MAVSETITITLNETMKAIQSVIPLSVHVQKPTLVTAPIVQPEMGVLIGITGDIRGRIIIEGDKNTFSKVGEAMFGMALEGDMLESFSGELGNMIAGNLSSNIYQQGINMDITPPTVMVGQTKLYGFHKAVLLPVELETTLKLNIVLMLEDK